MNISYMIKENFNRETIKFYLKIIILFSLVIFILFKLLLRYKNNLKRIKITKEISTQTEQNVRRELPKFLKLIRGTSGVTKEEKNNFSNLLY